MFQFRQFPTYTYEFSVCYTDMTPCGFPHSEIRGSMFICNSPRLIAAYHVFLRLPVPRHSPCALFSLTVIFLARFFHLPTKELLNCRFLLKSLSNDECFMVEHPSFCLYAVFVQFSRYDALESPSLSESGGLKWTRTTDLALIRRAL